MSDMAGLSGMRSADDSAATLRAGPVQVLIVDDEPLARLRLRSLVETCPEPRAVVVGEAGEGAEALRLIDRHAPEVVLLDVVMPGGNGLNLLRTLKTMHKSDGVIIISARNSLDDRILGLEVGADDYLPKPFHLAELGARIKALIRRNKFDGADFVQYGNLKVDFGSRTVYVNQTKLDLTKSELDLLFFLVVNKNKVVSKNAIGEHLSGDQADSLSSFDFIYSHIKNLKRKMTEAGSEDFIKTVYRLGYQFEV